MNKYIEADKLLAEIERRIGICKRVTEDERNEEDIRRYYHGKVVALEEIRHLADSLQQEQPKLPGYNKALLEVKSKVDELYEETSIGLSEYDSGLYNGIAETCMKLRGFIKARLED